MKGSNNNVLFQGIQVTATTPSSTGIRLKTGELTMEVTNQNPSSSVLNMPCQFTQIYIFFVSLSLFGAALGFFLFKHKYVYNKNQHGENFYVLLIYISTRYFVLHILARYHQEFQNLFIYYQTIYSEEYLKYTF